MAINEINALFLSAICAKTVKVVGTKIIRRPGSNKSDKLESWKLSFLFFFLLLSIRKFRIFVPSIIFIIVPQQALLRRLVARLDDTCACAVCFSLYPSIHPSPSNAVAIVSESYH